MKLASLLCRKKETALEQEIRMKEKQKEEAKVKQRNIKIELEQNELDYSSHSLDDIKNELAQVEDGIKQQEGKLDIDKVFIHIYFIVFYSCKYNLSSTWSQGASKL